MSIHVPQPLPWPQREPDRAWKIDSCFLSIVLEAEVGFQMEYGDKKPEGQCVCFKPVSSHRKKGLGIKILELRKHG